MRRVGVTGIGSALAAALLVAPSPPASATTPGPNGVMAFVRGTANCQDIYIVRTDGGTTKLTKCPPFIGTPAWSPNAKTLAVSYVSPSDNNFRLKLALLKATGGPVTVVSTGVAMSNSPVFSRDGSVLAFAGGDGGDDNLAIYTVPVTGGSSVKLVGSGANGEANDEPDWSPTADVIAWSRRVPMSSTFDVWTMTVDSSGHNPTALTNLTQGSGSSRYPSWSPDGAKLAFASDRSGTWQIYVMTADGSDVVPITTSGNNIQPAWSPDGRQIIYTSGCTTATCATSGPDDHRVNGDVKVVDVTDPAHPGAPRTVLNTSAAEFDTQWAEACSGAGCPVTALAPRVNHLESVRRGLAKGRVVATGAPAACHSHVPLILQYENAIDRGPKWHHGGHWVNRKYTIEPHDYRLGP